MFRFKVFSDIAVSHFALILLSLVAIDLIFSVLHISYYFQDERNIKLLLSREQSYGEYYQYFKEGIVVVGLLLISLRFKSMHILVWGFLFLYLLADDSLQIHEQFEHWVLGSPEYLELFGVVIKDLYQLIPSILVGTSAALILFPLYKRETTGFLKKISISLLILLILLCFFGIFVDLITSLIKGPYALRVGLDLFEDLGEMIVMSITCSYVIYKVVECKI